MGEEAVPYSLVFLSSRPLRETGYEVFPDPLLLDVKQERELPCQDGSSL